MAGGTDTHNGLVAAEEDNFFAKFPASEPRADRWNEDAVKFGDRVVKGWEMTAAGYTAVWATGNTRAELWDAMKRRETYATSGPHMMVRFFGGYDFTAADVSRSPAVAGYAKGVPMGGDLGDRARRAKRPRSWWPRSRTRTAATSIASRSSRAGSTRPASPRSGSTTSSGAMPIGAAS